MSMQPGATGSLHGMETGHTLLACVLLFDMVQYQQHDGARALA